KKLGVQLERIETNERKELAHIKSAYNQKRENIEQKFDSLETLIESIEVGLTISEEEYNQLNQYDMYFFDADMGAPAIKTLLGQLDLESEIQKLETEISETRSEIKKSKAIQRKKILVGM